MAEFHSRAREFVAYLVEDDIESLGILAEELAARPADQSLHAEVERVMAKLQRDAMVNHLVFR